MGLDRIKTRSQNRLDKEKLEFHLKVREGYLALAELYKDRFVVINGNQPLIGVMADIKLGLKDVF